MHTYPRCCPFLLRYTGNEDPLPQHVWVFILSPYKREIWGAWEAFALSGFDSSFLLLDLMKALVNLSSSIYQKRDEIFPERERKFQNSGHQHAVLTESIPQQNDNKLDTV